MPNFVPLMRAAKYMGVAPWDLAKQPHHYMEWALFIERAVAEADADIRRANQQKADQRFLQQGA